MEELIPKFKEIYDYASWEIKEYDSLASECKPFFLSLNDSNSYKRISRSIIPHSGAGDYYTLVEDIEDAMDESKKFRATITPHYTAREASEAMLLRLITPKPFVRMKSRKESLGDICFYDQIENPRIFIFYTNATVVSICMISKECTKEDLHKLASEVWRRIREWDCLFSRNQSQLK